MRGLDVAPMFIVQGVAIPGSFLLASVQSMIAATPCVSVAFSAALNRSIRALATILHALATFDDLLVRSLRK